MKKTLRSSLLLVAILAYSIPNILAQEQDTSPVQFSGSADLYYKYDFSNYRTAGGGSNIGTSFATDQNSLSLGMLNLIASKSVGKASFVGDISFGPRGQYQSLPAGDQSSPGSGGFHIQNLYASYQFTDVFSLTAGYMGTFVGYEVISPTANFNYSTSYLFTNGPFQNAGIKANFNFSEKAGLMVGLFNDWNVYQDLNGLSHVGAQLMLSPAEGWTAYFNVLSGRSAGGPAVYGSGTVLDLTTSYQISDKFMLGLNAADYTLPDDNGGYSGIALYPQISVNDNFAIGARGEYFKYKDAGGVDGDSFLGLTLSGNIKAGPLTVIPEVRFDNSKSEPFFSKSLSSSKSASQFLIAAVFAF